jgi:uncharacterized phage-associated protein
MSIPFLDRDSTHDVRLVTNYLIKRSLRDKSDLTPLQLMKLLYFSHAWMLAIFDRPLFKQTFKVWKYGPVVPEIYHALKQYGKSPITATISLDGATQQDFDPEETAVLDKVFDEYARFDGWVLSGLTHIPEGPWFNARLEKGIGSTISNKSIQAYYAQRRKRNPHGEE